MTVATEALASAQYFPFGCVSRDKVNRSTLLKELDHDHGHVPPIAGLVADLWTLRGAITDIEEGVVAWTPLDLPGSPPAPRKGAAMAGGNDFQYFGSKIAVTGLTQADLISHRVSSANKGDRTGCLDKYWHHCSSNVLEGERLLLRTCMSFSFDRRAKQLAGSHGRPHGRAGLVSHTHGHIPQRCRARGLRGRQRAAVAGPPNRGGGPPAARVAHPCRPLRGPPAALWG